MFLNIKKKCKQCKIEFRPNARHKQQHIFCSLECSHDFHRKKSHLRYKKLKRLGLLPKETPSYKCEGCGEITKLKFSPIMSKKWLKFKCPKCRKNNLDLCLT